MKKRILLVLTLLIAFFGFMGLSISNKQVDVYAAGDQNSVNSDLEVVLNNIPERAILSFPVTYESVYGNEISFAVEENQSAITYDDEAHWMVVDRANADTVTITVTVTGEGEAVAIGTKDVTVPEGVTATRSFAISYNYGYENPTELDNPKTSYKLGEASFDLATPTRYGYKFAGWYENEQYTGEPISKVLVGSMKDYTLYAKWTTMGFDANHVSFAEELDYTYDGQAKTPTMNVSNPYGDGNLVLGTDYQVSYDNNTNAGTDTATVTVTGIGEYAGSSVTKTFSIAPKALVITIDDQTKVYGESDPEFTYTVEGLIEADQSANLKIQRVEGTNVGEYAITSLYENTNYDITVNKGELTITKATLTFTPKEVKKYNLGITPSWSYNDFNISGLQYEESTSVLEGEITATYYQNDKETSLSTAGDYVAKFSGVSSNNYNITFIDGQVTVVVADVNFIPNVYTYNGTSQTLAVTVQDKEGNPINDGTLTYEDNEHTNAGTHSVKVRFDHSEHGIVETNVDIEIAKADLTINATSQDKTYGDLDPKKSGYFEAELQGDDAILEEWISRATGEAVGPYEVTLDTTELAKNYNIDGETATTLIITPKGLVIVAHAQTIIYGEGRPEKSVYFTSEDLVDGDVISEDWVTVEEGTNADTYEVTLNTTELSKNYDVSGALATTLIINPKDLEITINSINKTYGADDPDYLFDTTGLVDGDSLDVSGFSRVEGNDVIEGGYAISYDVSKMPNYNVSFNNDAVLTINPFNLTDKVTVTYNTMDANTQQGTYAVVPTVMYGETSITSFTTTYTYEDEETKLGNATLTITFSGNYTGTYTYNYVVTAKPKALEDGQVIATAMSQVTTVSNGQTLPTVQYGSSINWISNNTGVTVVDGKVVINEALLNGTTVTLTAYINFEDSSDVQQFTVNVETSKQTIYDETTKVTIEEVPGNLDVTVEDVKESEDSSNYIVEGEDLLGAYDITFSDKESQTEVKNPGTVIVKLPAPEGYESSDLTVYHILDNENRVSVEFDYVVEDEKGYLVFEADSFSPYVVVSLKKYTIKWSINDTVVEIDEVKHGVTPEYNGANPSKEKDQQYTYTFNGWSPVVSAATSDIIYVAQFATTTNIYTITWKNGDEVLDTDEVEYGAMPEYNGETPTKAEDENYTYTFAGWTPEITEVTNSVEYHAVFNNVEKENNNVEIEIEQWELVTDVADLEIGDSIIIAAENENYALSITQNTNNRSSASIVKNDNLVKLSNTVEIITLNAGNTVNTYSFVTSTGYLFSPGNGNYLRTEKTLSDNSSWNITIDETGNATITSLSGTKNWLRFNPNTSNNNPLFSCYDSGQQDIVIYKLIHTSISVPADQCSTITYDYGNGDEQTVINVLIGETIDEPTDIPVKENHRFLGWFLNEELYDFSNPVTENIVLIAGWREIVISSISYEGIDDCNDFIPSPNQYEEGVGVNELPIPNRIGFVFVGWELKGEIIEIIDEFNTGDIVLVARWEEQQSLMSSTITFSVLYSTNTTLTDVEISINEDVTVVFKKNSASSAPQYYTNGTSVRAYAKNSFEISSSSCKITSIVITYGTSDGSNAITTNVGSFSNNTWSGNSDSVIFTIGGTSGNRRISAITVTYIK